MLTMLLPELLKQIVKECGGGYHSLHKYICAEDSLWGQICTFGLPLLLAACLFGEEIRLIAKLFC